MARVVSSLQPAERDSLRTLVTFGAVIAGLHFGDEILVPIALAILLSFVLAPMVRLLHKVGLGRLMPVAVTVLLAFVILASLGGVMATQIRDLATDLPRYETTLVRKITYLRGVSSNGGMQKLEDAIARLSRAINRNTPEQRDSAGQNGAAPGPNATRSENTAAAPLPVQVVEPASGPLATMMALAAPLVHPLATTGIVLIFVVFILLQREDLRNRAIRLFGASDLQRTTAAIDDGAKRLSRYLITQVILNASAGVVVACMLWLVGVPSPILLGILFGCLRFVPYVGAVVGAVSPLLLAAAVDPGWSMVLWVAVLLVVTETIVGQVIEPVAYGHNTGLSPIAVVMAATFWTVLWGPVGLFLSTPLTVCLVVLGRHVEQLEFLNVLLGDQPPLSPPETFYQRMLARDPIEASDQAQRCLKDMSASEYYDNVALPGLLLAQDDVNQNRLDTARQEEIKAAAIEVVDDLDEDDADQAHPPAKRRRFWHRAKSAEQEPKEATRPEDLMPETVPERLKAPGSVLCVGARGPLDDAAAAMMAQVFKSYDIGARIEEHTRLSKAEIEKLDVSGVAMICLSALDGSSPAFLRFVLRRLRRRAPGAQILVGAWWRRDGLRESDGEIDDAIKDPKVTTFVDALRYCLAQADEPSPSRIEAPHVVAHDAMPATS